MRVFITGVAGFIGSNLARYLLDRNHQVIGLDNLAYGVRENIDPRVEFFEADITCDDLDGAFKDVGVVFHLAAKNCLNDCLNDPIETSRINVLGTARVLESARRAGIEKFVYADSSAEYEGIDRFPTPVGEIAPRSVYAVSKRSAALFVESYLHNFDLNVTCVRYFNVYGPAQDFRRSIPPVMSAFIIKLMRLQQPVIYGDGKKRRDFIHVDDVNRFHEILLQRPVDTRGKVYNLGTGVNYSVLDIYNEIESILKTGIGPVFCPELPGEAFETLADIREARQLGWTPEVPLRQGLLSMIEYIKTCAFQC